MEALRRCVRLGPRKPPKGGFRVLGTAFQRVFVAFSLNDSGFSYCRFRKCGEKSEIAEHNPIFANKTADRGRVKPGSGPQISVLPRTSESACRKYAANSGTHEHIALFAQRNRRYRRCGIPAWIARASVV